MTSSLSLGLLAAAVPALSFAQPEPPPPRAPATTAPAPPAGPTPAITIGGYVEAYYQAQLQNADNQLTNLRGFDNRSRTFTLSNVALDVSAVYGPVRTHVVVQVGHTGSTYYLAEPASPGTDSVNASGSELWKYLQTASVAVQLPADWVLEAGLVPSPIGFEVIPIKDNTHWSRSNLFFGLPFYHTGVTLAHPLGGGWTGKLHVYNGWNSVVDNNNSPSVAASAGYESDATTAQVLYLGGIERPAGAPEGTPWRNLFDALVQHAPSDRLAVAAQVNAGFETNDLGTSAWVAGAAYLKVALHPRVYAAVRGDLFYEEVAEDGGIRARPIFWPATWISSGTVTLAYQPVDGLSARLEYRHDQAADDVFFGGAVTTDPVTMTFVPDRTMQDTITLGVTAWF